MPSHDSEEFGGELYHDIIARMERSWGIWLDTVERVDERDGRQNDLAGSMMADTARDDEASLEAIRSLLEESTYETIPTPDAVRRDDTLAEGRQTMEFHHERLLGAIEAASQASNEILETVRERIGGLTWERYEERVSQLKETFSPSDS